jgi:hypothetical protein
MTEATKVFRFEYTDDAAGFGEFPDYKDINVTLRYDDGTTWCAVLRDFVQFLGHCYGYDISDQVQFESLDERLDRLTRRLEEQDEEEGDTKESDWV